MFSCKKSCWMAALVGAGVVIGAMGMGVVSQPADEMDMDAMMQAWMQLHQPDAHHKMLEPMAGEWTLVMEDRMGAKYSGSQSDQMGLGGRFLLSNVQMDMGGMSFEGMGCLGYDNMAKKYTSAWIDNMSTNILMHEGQASADGKSITLDGVYHMPDGSKVASRHVYHFGDGERSLVFYEGPVDGEMQKTGTITYTRK